MIARTTFCSLIFISVATIISSAFSSSISAKFCDENCTNDKVIVCYQGKSIRRCYAECLAPFDDFLTGRCGTKCKNCPMVYDIICGENKIIYPSECVANCFGWKMKCRGSCPCKDYQN